MGQENKKIVFGWLSSAINIQLRIGCYSLIWYKFSNSQLLSNNPSPARLLYFRDSSTNEDGKFMQIWQFLLFSTPYFSKNTPPIISIHQTFHPPYNTNRSYYS